MKRTLEEHEVASPRQLTYCAEFSVDSVSSDPSFAGPIEVRVEPGRIGFRWLGTRDWNWAMYHEAFFLLAEDPGHRMQEVLRDLKEQAREDGLKYGLAEAEKPAEERKPTVRFLLIPELAKTDG